MVPEPHELSDVNVDLTEIGQPTSLEGYVAWNPARHRAESATWVARGVIWVFGLTIVLVLLALCVIMLITRTPDDAKRFADTLVSVLDSLGKFVGSVFGPLLAFILGYYFSEKQKES